MSAPATAHHVAQLVAWEKLWRLLLAEESPLPDRPAPAEHAAVPDSKEVIRPSRAPAQGKRKAPASTGAREIRPQPRQSKGLTRV